LIGLAILPALFGNDGIWLSIIFREVSTIIVGIILLKLKPYGIKQETSLKMAA